VKLTNYTMNNILHVWARQRIFITTIFFL